MAADVTLDVDSDHDVDPDLARLQRAFAPNKTFARKEDFLSELKQLCLLLDRNYGCANGNNTTRHMVFCSTVSGNKNPLKIDGRCRFILLRFREILRNSHFALPHQVHVLFIS